MSGQSTTAPAATPTPSQPSTAERFFSGRDKLAFGMAALITFVGYCLSLQPSVGLEDSGEFLTAAYHLGVPHPPGYPIWSILAWLWCHIFPFGNIGWRVNLMSAAFGAVAVGLAALLISKTGHVMGARVGFLHQLPQKVVDRIVLGSAVAGSLMLAFAPVMWSQSVITEVYALNAFFLFVTLVYLYRWSFEPEKRWRLYFAAFVWGVSLTNHQTLVLLTVAFPAFVWLTDRKFGRDVLLPILVVIALVVLKMVMTKNSMFYQGPFTGGVVLLVGLGAAYWSYRLFNAGPGILRMWPQALAVYGAVILGLLLYAYVHAASATNPPMNWGYARTKEGFLHTFSRGQYEKTQSERAKVEKDQSGRAQYGVYWSKTLVKCWGQINLFFDDLKDQYTLPFALIALLVLFFYWNLDQADKNWLLFLLIAFLFLGLGFLFLSNPGFEKQKQFTDRVFFLPCHCLFSLWVGYGLILGLGYLMTRKPGVQMAATPLAAALLVLPAISAKLHWSDNEQGGHDFGYQFGYLMFKPGGDYPEMDRDAVLYGGTDPGRFVPTYMILVESLAPPRAKTHLPKFPESGTFDRSDVYIITQNALADQTYMSYIRDHYAHERPNPDNPVTLTNWPLWQQRVLRFAWTWLGRNHAYPKETIWIPSELDSQRAFSQYVQELQGRQPMPEEQVSVEGGRVSVQGVQGVMAINGILTKMIFEQNKEKHAFYVEESYVIPWMFPYLEPFGIILKINKEPLPSPEQDRARWDKILARDRQYWDALYNELKNSPRFKRDDVAQKTFSKLRSAIGGIYAFRGLRVEAEYAFQQGIELCPDSPEANYRLAQLYLQFGENDRAIAVLENYKLTDTYNTKIQETIDMLRQVQRQAQVERQLEQQLAADPNNLQLALQLVSAYASRQRFDVMDNLIRMIVARPDLSSADFLQLIQLKAQLNRLDSVGDLLAIFTQRYPQEPAGWYNIARLHSLRNDCNGAFAALQRALSLGQASQAYVSAAASDASFNNCRGDQRFQTLLGGGTIQLPLPEKAP